MSHPWMMPVSAWLGGREMMERAGPWDERLSRNQDGEYFCRVVSQSRFVKFVPESRFYYRKSNSGSITRSGTRRTKESLCLSFELEVESVLLRENSSRTHIACIKRLNRGVAMFEDDAPDLADRLRMRISELGGEIAEKRRSTKLDLIAKAVGRRRALYLKSAVWRTEHRVSCWYDLWMGKLFGTEL
jgi:hypothetical protein